MSINNGFPQVSILKRERLAEQIANLIQEYINSSKLAPGTRLPPGRELAERFRVSRVTISEAIRLVEERGLVQRIVGSGTYVTDKSRSAFVESMERLFVHSSSTFDDLMTFREIFEPNVAALAAERVTSEELVEMKAFLDQAEESWRQGQNEKHADADAAFHEALARATHNELLIAASAGVQHLLRHAIYAQYMAANDKDYENGILSHRPVYEAVATHNPKTARQAMEEHMHYTRRAMERVYRGAGKLSGD